MFRPIPAIMGFMSFVLMLFLFDIETKLIIIGAISHITGTITTLMCTD